MYAVVALLGFFLAQAGSSNSSSTAVTSEAKTRAQALLKEGSALFEQGDYQAALDKFETAYGIFPSPNLQFNIAQANRDLGRPVEALTAFENFLALASTASVDAREDARRSVADLHMKLGKLNIDCLTNGADVALDGKKVGTTPTLGVIWTTAGHHQVTARHPGFTPAIEDIEVKAASLRTVTLWLRPLPALPGAPDPPAAPSSGTSQSPLLLSSSAEQKPISRHPYQTYLWIGAGTTAVLALGATIAGLTADSRFSELQSQCGQSKAGCSESQIDSVKSRAHTADVLWILAGAPAASTGVVFYMDQRGTDFSLSWRY